MNYKSPQVVLLCLIIAYASYFSWYTIHRHNTLNSYAADLSLITQPMWNSTIGPGYFMELTWGAQQQPRLAEHFELILVPLAALFYLWDDVRILLIAQSVALAFGAMPVFLIARQQIGLVLSRPNSAQSNWFALPFVITYLLSPHLQAANIADFHADPFVVTPLLFAFWYASQAKWRFMWGWALVAMATKETLPTLTAMLGVWLVAQAWVQDQHRSSKQLQQGLLLMLVSTVWFASTTFLVVAPLAEQYFGTDGPIYLSNRYTNRMDVFWQIIHEPNRWHYLFGLFVSFGFLPLLAPDLLILGLPLFMANFFSQYSGQYSGEQHYSAPLVVALIIATIYGSRRLLSWLPRPSHSLICLCLWLGAWSLGYHVLHGWTPLSTRTEQYAMTSKAERLPDLLAQIPPQAIVSASPAIHPHLAHRQTIYIFPIVEKADYLLVDVADISGVHPNDVHHQITTMLANGWQLLEASEGLILAQRWGTKSPQSTTDWPDGFFNFARLNQTHPMYEVNAAFGQMQLNLLGYTFHDDRDDGLSFQFYWQAKAALPDRLQIWPLIYDDWGNLLNDPVHNPQITTVWYPPHKWQTDEIILTETLPQKLPTRFHLGLAVGLAETFQTPKQPWAIAQTAKGLRPDRWLQLASFERQGVYLRRDAPQPSYQPFITTQARFDSSIRLTGYALRASDSPNIETVSLRLRWQTATPLPTDYTVFVHLVDEAGRTIAQSDQYPTWIFSQPTSTWQPNTPIFDRHTLILPPDLPHGPYTIQVGLYDLSSLQRLTMANGHDAYPLTTVDIMGQ